MTTPFFNPGTRDGFDGTGAGELDGWLPVEYGDNAIQRIVERSVVEAVARTEPMAQETKTVGRFTNFTVGDVAKGQQYVASESYKDQIELVAKKVGGFTRIAEEDLRDLIDDPLAALRLEAADGLALHYDNSCLATTAAPGAGVKYRSVYNAVRATADDFDAEFDYTADDNYVARTIAQFRADTTTANNGYDTLSDLVATYETGRFFEPERTVVIADHALMGHLRRVKDANGNPAMTQNGVDFRGQPVYAVFNYPIRFARGARTSAVNTQAPTGNPLLIIGNSRMMIRGTRALAPQIPADTFGVALQRSAQGPGFLSDEAYMKAAFRRAFNVGTATAFGVLEITP